MCVTAASGGALMYYQCAPSAILKPKNKTKTHGGSQWALLPRGGRGAALQGNCRRLASGWGERRPRRLLALGRETSKGNLEPRKRPREPGSLYL
jgi:hypothetical protein